MSVSFLYPWNAPSETVELRDPELGDSFNIVTKATVKTMMDGSIRTMRRTPAKQQRQLNFVLITRTRALEFAQFLTDTDGKLIKFLDFDGTNWVGYLLSDPEEIRTVARGLGNEPLPEQVDFGVTFEGMKL